MYVVAAVIGTDRHKQQAAAKADRVLGETAASGNIWIELNYFKGDSFLSLGLFGDSGA